MVPLYAIEQSAADVRQGHGFRSWFYTSTDVLELERRAVFERAWQFAVHENQIAKPGSYALANLGEFEVIVARDPSGNVQAFRNVCLHRGSRLVDSDGEGTTLVCPYHAWSYGLNARLRKAPGFEQDERVVPDAARISRAQIDRLGPLLFATLAPDPLPFSEVTGPLQDLCTAWPALIRHDRRKYFYDCNWKMAIENSLECYHCPVIHGGFDKLIDLKNYIWEVRGFCGITGGQRLPATRSGVYSAAAASDETSGRYYFVWPNLHLLLYPGPPNLTIARWLPVGVNRTVCVRDFYFGEAFTADQRTEFIAYVEEIQREDIRACDNIQSNVCTGAFQRSLLRLTEDGMGEHGIRQFQKLLLDALHDGVLRSTQGDEGMPPTYDTREIRALKSCK